MSNLAHAIEEYISKGQRHAFKLKNGQKGFGRLFMEYDESGDNVDYTVDYILHSPVANPLDYKLSLHPYIEDEIKIKLEDIDLDSLYYWDNRTPSDWIKFAVDVSLESQPLETPPEIGPDAPHSPNQ